MISLISFLFILTVLGGLYLLSYIYQNKNTPKAVALMHGLMAFLGIVFLFFYAAFVNASFFLSLIFFLIAAALGGLIFFYDITGRYFSKWLVMGHGLFGLIGLILLAVVTFYLT